MAFYIVDKSRIKNVHMSLTEIIMKSVIRGER